MDNLTGGFSEAWERTYAAGAHRSLWPWSDLVSYAHRYAAPLTEGVRVLELGPGAGANIPFFREIGARYFGVDGSLTAVLRLRQRFPEYAAQIEVGDFTRVMPFTGPFDLVVDRGSLTHNTTEDIRRAVALLRQCLRPGGGFIGIDWFSTQHDDAKGGTPAEDAWTRTAYTEGQFTGVGRVHFSDEGHLRELLQGFDVVALEHKTVDSMEPARHRFASWMFAARKKVEAR